MALCNGRLVNQCNCNWNYNYKYNYNYNSNTATWEIILHCIPKGM